jgi:hypothetical protein
MEFDLSASALKCDFPPEVLCWILIEYIYVQVLPPLDTVILHMRSLIEPIGEERVRIHRQEAQVAASGRLFLRSRLKVYSALQVS